MRLPTLLSTLLAATANLASASDTTRTAAIYIQPLTNPSTPPSLLAELALPDPSSSPAADAAEDPTAGAAAEVLSYSAPELPDDPQTNLVRIGIYDPAAQHWVSSTSVASTDNFAKGYAPHFALTLDGAGNPLGVACRGVAIDAGVTRDFGPQAVVVRTEPGPQPALGKPVVLSPEGRKIEVEEKPFWQKYVICVAPVRRHPGSGWVAVVAREGDDANWLWQVLVGAGYWGGFDGYGRRGSEVIDWVHVGVSISWVLQCLRRVKMCSMCSQGWGGIAGLLACPLPPSLWIGRFTNCSGKLSKVSFLPFLGAYSPHCLDIEGRFLPLHQRALGIVFIVSSHRPLSAGCRWLPGRSTLVEPMPHIYSAQRQLRGLESGRFIEHLPGLLLNHSFFSPFSPL
jgi:hypothetical protein